MALKSVGLELRLGIVLIYQQTSSNITFKHWFSTYESFWKKLINITFMVIFRYQVLKVHYQAYQTARHQSFGRKKCICKL